MKWTHLLGEAVHFLLHRNHAAHQLPLQGLLGVVRLRVLRLGRHRLRPDGRPLPLLLRSKHPSVAEILFLRLQGVYLFRKAVCELMKASGGPL